MKRIALLTMLSLVMCLTMSFPASAAYTVKNERNLIAMMEKVKSELSAKYPVGYDYVMFYSDTATNLFDVSVNKIFRFFVTNSPNINLGSIVYHGFVNGTSITHSSNDSQDRYTKVTKSLYYNQTGKYYVLGCTTYLKSNNSIVGTEGAYITYGIFSQQSTANIFNYEDMKVEALTKSIDIDWRFASYVDPSALQALISQSKAKENTGYTQSSWQALQLQITAAENLLLTTGYTQEHVNNKVALLQAALDGLTLLPDTSELDTLLLEADAIENIGYTSETWARFVASRSSARSLVSSADYTQSELDYIMSELMAAINGLTLNAVKPPEPPTKPPAPLGYDVGSGDISGYFAPVPKVFYVYIVSVFPVVVGLFSIILSIKLLPRLGSLILKNLRR